MSDKQKITLRIAGKDHVLSCSPEDASGLAAAAHSVDQRVSQLRSANAQITSERAIALAALDIAFEHAKLQQATAAPDSGTAINHAKIEQLNQRLDKAIASIQALWTFEGPIP